MVISVITEPTVFWSTGSCTSLYRLHKTLIRNLGPLNFTTQMLASEGESLKQY